MNVLTFIVEMTKAISWPITVLVVVFVFRKPLLDLFKLIRKVKYKNIEVEIAKMEIAETRELSVVSGKTENLSPTDLQHFRQLAEISPRAAITEAWTRIETMIYQTAKGSGIDSRPAGVSFSKILSALREAKVIEPLTLQIIEKMRKIRNMAVHFQSEALNYGDAMDYALAMKQIEATLKLVDVNKDKPKQAI